MTEITDNNELPEQPAQALPGTKLRAAREARGLSREEVAAQLRLQLRLITALEEDDYDALPGQAFVSGYLRSYARLLGLPEDAFVASAAAKSEPPPLVAPASSRKQASSSDWLTRLATLLIIGLIAVSVAMWWLAQRQEVETEASAPEVAITAQGGESALTLPVTPPQTAEETTGVKPEEPEATGEGPAPEPVPVSDTATSEQAEETQEASAQSSEAEKSAPPPLTEEMPQSKLELRYTADCWTEVSDNAGRQLVYGLIKADQVLILRGEAPFRVFLGYAPGVEVYYNNDLFDHSPFQRRDVARFRIGRAEHNHPGSR